MAPFVKPISFDDDRVVGLEGHFVDMKILFLGVNLPYDNKRNFDDYIFTTSSMKAFWFGSIPAEKA